MRFASYVLLLDSFLCPVDRRLIRFSILPPLDSLHLTLTYTYIHPYIHTYIHTHKEEEEEVTKYLLSVFSLHAASPVCYGKNSFISFDIITEQNIVRILRYSLWESVSGDLVIYFRITELSDASHTWVFVTARFDVTQHLLPTYNEIMCKVSFFFK